MGRCGFSNLFILPVVLLAYSLLNLKIKVVCCLVSLGFYSVGFQSVHNATRVFMRD